MLRAQPETDNGRPRNQQIVDSATLFATRAKYIEILQEKLTGLISRLLLYLVALQISNLDTHKISVYTKYLIIL